MDIKYSHPKLLVKKFNRELAKLPKLFCPIIPHKTITIVNIRDIKNTLLSFDFAVFIISLLFSVQKGDYPPPFEL